jgi:hypothetical protein
MVTDYCTGDAPPSPGFQAYVTLRGYKLVTPAVYGDLIRAAGFEDVVVEDRTTQVSSAPTDFGSIPGVSVDCDVSMCTSRGLTRVGVMSC